MRHKEKEVSGYFWRKVWPIWCCTVMVRNHNTQRPEANITLYEIVQWDEGPELQLILILGTVELMYSVELLHSPKDSR